MTRVEKYKKESISCGSSAELNLNPLNHHRPHTTEACMYWSDKIDLVVIVVVRGFVIK